MNEAFEDIRKPVLENQFDQLVQSALDTIEENSTDAIEHLTDQNDTNQIVSIEVQHSQGGSSSNVDFENSGISDIIPHVGDKIEVYWPLENKYYPGTVEAKQDDGKLSVAYDDGDMETSNQ